MDFSPKPIKRSKELAPLSREHHVGLLFCWKIKQGLRNGTDYSLIANYIQWFWEADLQEHFRKEEQILAVQLPVGNEMVKQMMDEHEQLEALVRICAMVSDEDIFLQLANGLHDHIRFEERLLFPFVEQVIPKATLESIGKEFLVTKPYPKWEEEFWVKKQ